MALTITEALAEIKTIDKRLLAKRQSILQYIARQDNVRDPLQATGGSAEYIRRERQSISDLETRLVVLRQAIQKANDLTSLTINGDTKTLSAWLTWRREIAAGEKNFLGMMRVQLNATRNQAIKAGVSVLTAPSTGEPTKDFVINIDESALAGEIENMETTLGTLDGQLSLKNATVLIEA